MSSSVSLEEKVEALIKSYQTILSLNQELKQQNDYMSNANKDLRRQNEYLQRQLDKSMKMKQKALTSPSRSNHGEMREVKRQHCEFEDEAKPRRLPRRKWHPIPNSNDFRVDILEFKGKLDSNEFLEWLHIVEHIFEYKVVPEDIKVKLVALRLRKYASLWWTNLCCKGTRDYKDKIRTWEKMKAKLKSSFCSPFTFKIVTHNFTIFFKEV